MDSTTIAYSYQQIMLPESSFAPVVHLKETNAPTRRQNRSCDQCRKGKRKCDAVIPRDWPFKENEEVDEEVGELSSISKGLPN